MEVDGNQWLPGNVYKQNIQKSKTGQQKCKVYKNCSQHLRHTLLYSFNALEESTWRDLDTDSI